MRIESMKPNKIIAGKKFFIVEDLVRILGLTELTVRKYLQEKRIKSVKVGRRFYIEQKNLEVYLGGGRFFDQPDDLIMNKINEAIKLTFESNVPWLANEVKKLITKDLTGIMSERFKQIDENNKQFSGRIAEQLKDREKDTKKDFEKAKQM